MTDFQITRLSDRWSALSNFFHATMLVPASLLDLDVAGELSQELVEIPTLEHAFQAAKMANQADKMKILEAPGAGAAKRTARRLRMRDDWEDVKDQIMLDLLRLKFTENQTCKQTLLLTDDITIIEGNTWHDQVWGNCECGERAECAPPGENRLGRMLEQVREEIKRG